MAQRSHSVRENAGFVQEIAKEHGSFGKFLATWPSSDEIGLLDLLAKRGSRLGGNTGQMFLRFVGWDGFVTSQDVVACLREAGLDIAAEVKSKGDLAKVQAQFNAWAAETGLPYVHLSRICAMSIGENHRRDVPRFACMRLRDGTGLCSDSSASKNLHEIRQNVGLLRTCKCVHTRVLEA